MAQSIGHDEIVMFLARRFQYVSHNERHIREVRESGYKGAAEFISSSRF